MNVDFFRTRDYKYAMLCAHCNTDKPVHFFPPVAGKIAKEINQTCTRVWCSKCAKKYQGRGNPGWRQRERRAQFGLKKEIEKQFALERAKFQARKAEQQALIDARNKRLAQQK